MSDSIAGPSALSEPPSLRKLAKSPARTLALADISLDESRLDRVGLETREMDLT